MERQIQQNDFNSYGSRRGNHEVMIRVPTLRSCYTTRHRAAGQEQGPLLDPFSSSLGDASPPLGLVILKSTIWISSWCENGEDYDVGFDYDVNSDDGDTARTPIG